MKISYADSKKEIIVEQNRKKHTLYSEESCVFEGSSAVVSITTVEEKKVRFCSVPWIFFKRLIAFPFNAVCFNYPQNWIAEADPFVLSVSVDALQENTEITYHPSKISISADEIELPTMSVNGVTASNSKVRLDTNALDRALWSYCFDIIIPSVFVAVIVTLCFISKLWPLFATLLVLLFSAPVFAVGRALKRKRRFLLRLNEIITDTEVRL